MLSFDPDLCLDGPLRDAGTKLAADQTVAYNLAGRFYVSESHGAPWGLLAVPNSLVRGVFDAMHEPGIELPGKEDGRLDAHITVMRPEEIELLGGPDALLNDRGKVFKYTVGRLMEFEPKGWAGVSKCWAVIVHSPELQQLRRSHGLSSIPKDGEFAFHITVAVRRRGVLGASETAKDTVAA